MKRTLPLIAIAFAFLAGCCKDPVQIGDESSAYLVSTVARGDTGTNRIFEIDDLVADNNGNLFMADAYQHKIFRVSPSGHLTVYSGTGNRGGRNGAAAGATFDDPRFLAIDPQNNLWIVDSFHLRLRRITPQGIVSTVYQGSSYGYVDGPLATARFEGIDAIAFDNGGNLYLGDGGKRLRKITAAGVVSTIAGGNTQGSVDGTRTEARFILIHDLGLDPAGNIFVVDNSRLRKVTPGGNVSTLITYPGISQTFSYLPHLAIDGSGTVYTGIAPDVRDLALAKLTVNNTFTRIAGRGYGETDGPGSAARFLLITHLAAGPGNTLYVTDQGKVVRKVVRQ